ncbi:GNAT family N-acetyltransferase [Candidatus Bathyarchaeota archaeon]|nr:GNAT family N-acetyltransferase [Candidatus Bathyarchaeota archaeon]
MGRFRIVYYDELDDVFQITILYYLSLGWPATPKVLEELRRNDDRYMPEFGMFAVDQDGTVMASVLLMEIPTKTLNGKLNVGGLNAVATRPGYHRRGVMTTLITRIHEYFMQHQLDYSFLTTAQSLGAHSMYEKLGYKDLMIRERAWKMAREPPLRYDEKIVVTKFQEENGSEIDKIFREATEGSCGFVYRPTNFLKARFGHSSEFAPEKKMRLAKRRDEISGYAYWESSSRVSACEEILALDKSSFVSLLADAEKRFRNKLLVIHCGGLSKREVDWLQSAGFHTGIQTYGTVVVDFLRGDTNLESIKSLFGVSKGLFRMGTWDST